MTRGETRADTFVLQTGGLGDVVLTSQLIEAVKRAAPDERVVLAIDASLERLPSLFPVPPDEVCPLNLRPFARPHPGRELLRALIAVQARVQEYTIGTFVGAAFRPRWFSYCVAAVAGAGRVVFSEPIASANDARDLQFVLDTLAIASPEIERPGEPASRVESARYAALIDYLTHSPSTPPRWRVSDPANARARAWLESAGLGSRPYVVCFPLVSNSTPVKAWPLERFETVLDEVAEPAGLSTLLVGALADRAELCAAVERMRGHAVVSAGADFELLLGLLAAARAYLGNDTGPAHLAEALGLPGVLVFGGGHWPAYAPWSKGTVALIHTLPCFGCDWDCLFDHAYCVRGTTTGAVAAQFRLVLDRPPLEPRVVDTAEERAELDDVIRRATRRYRAVVDELAVVRDAAERREDALHATAHELAIVREAADQRAEALEAMAQELANVRGEAERRAAALEEVTRALAALQQPCPTVAES